MKKLKLEKFQKVKLETQKKIFGGEKLPTVWVPSKKGKDTIDSDTGIITFL